MMYMQKQTMVEELEIDESLIPVVNEAIVRADAHNTELGKKLKNMPYYKKDIISNEQRGKMGEDISFIYGNEQAVMILQAIEQAKKEARQEKHRKDILGE